MKFDHWNGLVEIEEKALRENDDHWTLTGYAATYDQDRVGDIIVPGAFKRCLDRMSAKSESLQLYFNHKLEEPPIGTVETVAEDRKGLRYEAHLPKDDTFVASRIIPQIKRRSLRSNSFGYKVRQSERRKSDNVRLLKEIDIFEISVVGIPANPAANIEGVKGVVPFLDLPIDPRSTWDAQAAVERLRKHFGCENGPSGEYKSAFLFVDEEKADDFGAYILPIADVDDSGRLVANRVAVMKAVAALSGGRKGDLLPEEAEEQVRATLERYYQRLNLDPPFKSLSVTEWKALDVGERKARLQEFGLSRSLAAELAIAQQPRSAMADRTPSQTQVGSPEEAKQLLTAFSALIAQAAAISPIKT